MPNFVQRVKYITLLWLFYVVVIALVPFIASAQCDSATQLCNPLEANTFGELVKSLARAVTAIAIPIVVIFLIYSGFLFVSARGNEKQLETVDFAQTLGAANP